LALQLHIGPEWGYQKVWSSALFTTGGHKVFFLASFFWALESRTFNSLKNLMFVRGWLFLLVVLYKQSLLSFDGCAEASRCVLLQLHASPPAVCLKALCTAALACKSACSLSNRLCTALWIAAFLKQCSPQLIALRATGMQISSSTDFDWMLCSFLQQQHRILNVNVGYPGVVHDTRVLYNSKLYKDQQAFLGGPSINVN
jgi:hypothetical protein